MTATNIYMDMLSNPIPKIMQVIAQDIAKSSRFPPAMSLRPKAMFIPSPLNVTAAMIIPAMAKTGTTIIRSLPASLRESIILFGVSRVSL